ncbi:MAG: hypothetical protein H0T56_00200 [Pseudaminobacter sp.]|nr:hypothetical protein [Pseudaminobacter sp.]
MSQNPKHGEIPVSRTFPAILLLTLVAAVPAAAQNQGGAGGHGTAAQAHTPSLYSGMETRRVKALSEEQIADLEVGRGMGLALAAELNGYPGPLHVLELAETLDLTDEQERRTQELLETMKVEAIPTGRRLIDQETMLDSLFAEKKITVASLDEATTRIAVAQGELRAAHLRYHLVMADILLPEQNALYARLRGYAARTD